MALDRNFLNVNILGIAFMLVFTAFQTTGIIQQTVISSIKKEDPNFSGDGYTAAAITYGVFALSNWVSPSIITVIGPKFTMVIGSILYALFIAGFLVPQTWILYTTSALVGFGAAFIWTGQGNYLTLNSNSDNISRNSGIFWAELQCSFLLGNVFIFFQFQGKDIIDEETRTITFSVLLAVGLLGSIMLLVLPQMRDSDAPANKNAELGKAETVKRSADVNNGPMQAFKKAVSLFFTKDMALLSVAFFYMGIEFCFLSGVYSSSIGFTKAFEDGKRLVGLSGIFIGVGEIVGGALFGIFGSRFNKYGRDPVILIGFLAHAVGFFIVFLNLPDGSPLGDCYEAAFITSSPVLAIFCSFLIAFGDACYNTQVYSILAGIYPNDSAPAFALFKFVNSVAASCSFVYSSHFGLYIQLSIICVLGFAGTICFWIVEWRDVYKRLHKVQKAVPDSLMADED